MTKTVTYIEIDLPYCALTYGLGACTAALGTTGSRKCFNSLGTCQDRPNFDDQPVTLRFAVDAPYLSKDIDCIESVVSVSYSPGTISFGRSLGQRASISVTFADHRSSDRGPGLDKYAEERPYDAFSRGTFWGKLRTRHPYLHGRPLRRIQGLEGQKLHEMETRHFVIESHDGPTQDGMFTIVAKDVLKLLDADRAQAPRVSNGVLSADIDTDDTAVTLLPSGIGNEEYPASGYVCLGGKEVCSFTRSGDSLTLTRAQYNTSADSHKSGDRVQLCLEYVNEDPADILYDLFTAYGGILASQIPLSSWQAETGTYLQRVYSTLITEPTGVDILANELIEQAALAVWPDEVSQQIQLTVLRSINLDTLVIDDERRISGTYSKRDQPGKLINEVWVFFGRRDPTQPLTNENNYSTVEAVPAAQQASDYGDSIVHKIYSRWIGQAGATVAIRLADILLARYATPPRLFAFDLPKDSGVVLGGGYRVADLFMQDDTGGRIEVPVQVSRLNPGADRDQIEAEEMIFTGVELDDPNNHVILLQSNALDFNLRTAHDSVYPPIGDPTGITVNCIISDNVIVGASSTSMPAFDVGNWPEGLTINVQVLGRIEGHGGNGGLESSGNPGGTALYTRYPINLAVDEGEIWSGGGAGGRGGFPTQPSTFFPGLGGGGGGQLPGAAGEISFAPQYNSQPGTTEAGGAGGTGAGGSGNGGAGGAPGVAGTAGNPGTGTAAAPGGAAGPAIDGVSYVTVTEGPGDIRGSQVN